MSSRSGPDAGWSLTRRLAAIFALTSCGILALHTAVIAKIVTDTLREGTRNFIQHELSELSSGIDESDGSEAAIRDAVQQIAHVTEEPPCAFRARRSDGTLIAESGSKRLQKLVREPIPPDTSWRSRLFTDHIALGAVRRPADGIRLEIVSDASATVAVIREFIWMALGLFLVAAAASAVGAWFTAHRGLRGLLTVVERARSAEIGADLAEIELDGAPEEVRAVGDALNAMMLRIRGELDAMRTFTAGLAHELRSPLQNLIGETEVTLLSERSPEEYAGVLHSNLEDLHALSDAVDNLVTYCRSAAPSSRTHDVERFDLAEEARLRLARESRTAERADVALRLRCEGQTALAADRESCLRVLRNLVANAITWSPPGTAVDVLVEGEAEAVRLVVEDRGPGVASELLGQIFEPFVTGNPRAGRRGGYGLGLAICRAVMTEHGGSIVYEPREGGGSRFVAVFPRGPSVTGVASPRLSAVIGGQRSP